MCLLPIWNFFLLIICTYSLFYPKAKPLNAMSIQLLQSGAEVMSILVPISM